MRGAPVSGLACTRPGGRFAVHLEIFAHRRVVIVPAEIGVAKRPVRDGRVRVGRWCSYAARTVEPTGVIEVRRGSLLRLSDFFSIWGRPLARFQLLGFRSRAPVLAFVNGRRWSGDPRRIPLRRHAEIVLEIAGHVPPHRFYLFPRGS